MWIRACCCGCYCFDEVQHCSTQTSGSQQELGSRATAVLLTHKKPCMACQLMAPYPLRSVSTQWYKKCTLASSVMTCKLLNDKTGLH